MTTKPEQKKKPARTLPRVLASELEKAYREGWNAAKKRRRDGEDWYNFAPFAGSRAERVFVKALSLNQKGSRNGSK